MTSAPQDPDKDYGLHDISANPEAYTLEEIQDWVLSNQDDGWLSEIYDTLDDLNDMYYVIDGPTDSDLNGDNIVNLGLGSKEE